MAAYRDSAAAASAAPYLQPVPDPGDEDRAGAPAALHDRSIGEILRRTNELSQEQVDQVLAYQRQHGLRFGEAAIALGHASDEDVMFALSQQFHYHYASVQQRQLDAELVMANQPFSFQSESFRAMRSQLLMRVFTGEEPKRALAVVSPDIGDGKTFFCANMAVALSQLGGRTLLVDADLRGPRLHEVFGLANTSGLSGILSGRAEANVILPVPDLPSLFLLPVGITPPNPVELVERPAFALLMRELVGKFDHVIVDTPALVYGADAGVIAAKCGAALVVARRGRSRVNRLQDLVAHLSDSPAKLAGVVMNEF